jgi:hypothetical protein
MVWKNKSKAMVVTVLFSITMFVFPGIILAAESSFSHDFGEVEQGETYVATVDISTSSSSNVNLLSLVLQNGSDFQIITTVPDGGIIVPPNESVPIKVSFTPTELGPATDTIIIRTNNRSIRSVAVNLSGIGIPGISVEDILKYFDEAVASGSLTGSDKISYYHFKKRAKKKGIKINEERLKALKNRKKRKGKDKLAERRLHVFRKRLESVDLKVLDENINEACEQLSNIYAKTDSIDPPESPPDFLEGDGKEDLANMIDDLKQKLKCN